MMNRHSSWAAKCRLCLCGHKLVRVRLLRRIDAVLTVHVLLVIVSISAVFMKRSWLNPQSSQWVISVDFVCLCIHPLHKFAVQRACNAKRR